jgi:hypothetical protein
VVTRPTRRCRKGRRREAVLFATLSAAGKGEGYRRRGATANDVAEAVIAAQTDSLIARKLKVNGKVAYVLRERREGEERATNVWDFPAEQASLSTA